MAARRGENGWPREIPLPPAADLITLAMFSFIAPWSDVSGRW